MESYRLRLCIFKKYYFEDIIIILYIVLKVVVGYKIVGNYDSTKELVLKNFRVFLILLNHKNYL